MKKIINTILGVLVKWFWEVVDAIKDMVNNLDFIVHWKRNKQEIEDFDKEKLSFNKRREEFTKKLQEEKNKYDELNLKYIEKKNRYLEVQKKLGESNLKYQDEFHKYTELSVKYDELKDKSSNEAKELKKELDKYKRMVIYRDGVIKDLRKENDELRVEKRILTENLKINESKNKFLESKLPKKTLEEIVAYTFSQKEVLKRSKKNEQ